MTDDKLTTLIETRKSKKGGARPGAGRKRKMEEHEIIEKLSPMAPLAFQTLEECLRNKDLKAVQIFLNYFIGMPTQRVENKIEGQLNQVSVEVVRPQVEEVSAN